MSMKIEVTWLCDMLEGDGVFELQVKLSSMF